MWKSKKVVLLAALAIALLIGSAAAGVTLAQSGGGNAPPASGNESQPGAQYEALLGKVVTIYEENTGVTLDAQQLQDAFSQAQTEMRTEARSGSGNESQPGDQCEALLSKVVTIYEENTGVTIDVEQLKAAYTQAQAEMQTEALQSRLQDLVTQGKITQEQADEYMAWWNSKPDIGIDIPLPGLSGVCDMMMRGRGPDFGGGNGTAPQTMPGFGGGNGTAPQTLPGFGGGNSTVPQTMPDFGGGNSAVPQMPDFGGGNSTVPQMMPGFGGRR